MRTIKAYCTKRAYSKTYNTLTVGQLKKYRGLQSLSEAEAMQAINAIEKLSNLLFYMFKNGEIFDYEKESVD
jgi:hypothetical protein